jgi:hypothetical protein
MELRPKGKILFLTLAICIVFSVVFAETIIADNFEHDCKGEGCPVCLTIETVNNFIKSLKLFALVVFLAVCPMFPIHTSKNMGYLSLSFISPITLKVRFNS